MEKKLRITNDLSQLSKLHPFIEQAFEELDIKSEDVFKLNLVIEEVLTNVILYAYPGSNDKYIELTIISNESTSEINIRVVDQGIPFDPTKQVPEVDTTSSAIDRPIGGLGFFLVKQMVDSVEYEYKNGENILTMIKKV